ncbi:MAG: hypothetical protein GC161_10785 [Planctomycetaceae bacterium]|nr:hypothetical protein [Planctomycetaceae bacterium]
MWMHVLCLGLFAAAPQGAEPRPATPAASVVEERLAAWPALDAAGRRLVGDAVERLTAARTEAMAESGRVDLVALGEGAAPKLLEALGKARDEATRARIGAVLDELTAPRHTALLAAEFDHTKHAVRHYCLWRVGVLGDARLASAAEAALGRAAARIAKAEAAGTRGEADLLDAKAERLAAALACAGTGSVAGFDVLLEHAAAHWSDFADDARRALRGVKGPAATAILVPKARGGAGKARIAALWLLAAAGEGPAAVDAAGALLDEDDTSTRIAAINVLRALVDGEAPIDNLSVFEGIELAKRWKERLR